MVGPSILITGATGFIGCRLAELARQQDFAVIAWGVVNSPIEESRRKLLEDAGVEVAIVDLTDRLAVQAAMPKVDAIIHLGAAQHEASESEEYFNRVNVDGTRNLLTAAANARVSRFVFGSTIGVYGGQTDIVLDETSARQPANKYGRSKSAAEDVITSFDGEIEVCIARIAETYGPGDRRLLKLFKGIRQRNFFVMGDGANLHQLAYVDDLCCDLLLCAVRAEVAGTVVILAGDESLTTDEMCRTIARAVDRPLVPFRAPIWPFSIAAYCIEKLAGVLGRPAPISRRSLDFFSKSYRFSTQRRLEVLGREHEVRFSEGAAVTAEWYRRQALLEPKTMKLPDHIDFAPPTQPVDSSKLAARIEPFDSYWQGPEDLASAFESFGAYYRTNYLPRMPSEKSAKTLVVSCGPGYLVNELVAAGYTDIVGIDSDPGKIAIAEQRELPCVCERAFEFLQRHETTYDVIILEQELNHLTHQETIDFLRLCRSRMRRGSRIIAYAMNGANPMVGSENLAHNIDHFYTVAEFSLKQLMALGGFDGIEIFPLKIYVFWRNPLNYVGLVATGLLEFVTKAIFKLYGKNVGVLSKKIAAIAYLR